MSRLDVPVEASLGPVAAVVWNQLEFGRKGLLKQMEGLAPEQLAARPAGFKNSLAALLCHIAGSEVNFACILKGETFTDELKAEFFMGRVEGLLRQPEGESVESLTAKLNQSRAAMKEALAGLGEADLERVFPGPGGSEYTMRWLLALIPHHASMHLGQMQMLRQHLV